MESRDPRKKPFRKGEEDARAKHRQLPVRDEVTGEEVPVVAGAEEKGPVAPVAPKRFAPRKVESEFVEKVVVIKRVTKVTKGGKKLSFSALVVVGDGKGRVGYYLDKAGEVATAIKKSLGGAKKNMVQIPLKGTTIPHEIIGVCGSAEVLLKPASEGTGVIASAAVRAVCDGAGIHDILTKCHRSNNPINVVKATMDGLTRLKIAANKIPETTNVSA